MKKVSKQAKLLTTLLLLVLAFFSVVNVTYSYFTAQAKADGTLNFPDMQVNFMYWPDDSGAVTIDATTLTLYPVEEVSTGVYDTCTISRGNTFKVSLTEKGAPIDLFGIINAANSCDVYVRFWFDAIVVNDSGVAISDTNYGKYFVLEQTSKEYTNTASSAKDSWCYFTEFAIAAGDDIGFGNSIKLTEDAPVELLGKKLKLTISFEAVQVANDAYLEVFGKAGDTKGYNTNWGIDE